MFSLVVMCDTSSLFLWKNGSQVCGSIRFDWLEHSCIVKMEFKSLIANSSHATLLNSLLYDSNSSYLKRKPLY
jgi:hypothetical protein